MTLEGVILEAARCRELVAEYDRLTGSNLSRRGDGLELAIDDASGRTDAEIKAFVAFVVEAIWLPLVMGAGR